MTNRSLLKIFKTRLKGAKGTWPKELLNILWAYRTMTKVPTRTTPFRLTFGTEVVIPVEVGLTSIHVKTFEERKNQQELNSNLDLVNKVRDEARLRMAKYKELDTTISEWRSEGSTQEISSLGKFHKSLRTHLKGSWDQCVKDLKVVRYSRQGSYHLKTMDSRELPCSWNTEHLKKYSP